ncbi:MAG: DUF87 domain-containing protein [Acidobacteria bacterium]|nr:MAG: DUF87 domain-containing protein [Acidobacteriota bacterium]REJ98176.1 MAG: DUF87 domain-containing protein [Acidobacteriota bacterium]REK16919.1 MAG: DUF87 domain-containing protein [Acidobacteriota bacterium]REK42830.1 MAG: DUF87 domain-containing protein [Acidobacteriota bacterium]
MNDFEKLGLFYLGKEYDPAAQDVTDELLLYDSKDLTTHGVLMGMTGSGKTGLGVALIEEAAIDNIPAIVIDPKGDMTNLLLTFPNLSKEEFLPWVNADEAAQKGESVEDFAQKQADLWRSGLAKWGQQPERIKMFEDAAERVLYTPGSTSGRPVSILKSFTRPQNTDDLEALAERVSTLVSGLLGLIDIDADPLSSKEHILLSNIIQTEWLAGRDVEIVKLISLIQDPPMDRIGAFEVEAYYPKKERFELATLINNLIASPQFAVWTTGDGIDIDDLFYTEAGKPRISIVSIAHLDDKQRMFFVTLLLNELVSWMRAQSGTGSLRCLLYMDEIFGYLPPVANPPSKRMFLTLLKQARAFGLGLVLATQNPGDLDYKALSNVGTWFIGRLQTERDKEKVLEGLLTANSGADKGELSRQLAGLGKRVFLMNNTKDNHPVLFNTRWVLSYLAGPIMRNRFKELIGEDQMAAEASSGASAAGAAAGTAAATATAEEPKEPEGGTRPILSPDIQQTFVPGTGKTYKPHAICYADVHYEEKKLGIAVSKEQNFQVPVSAYINWDDATPSEFGLEELESEPREGRGFASLEAEVTAKTVSGWEKDFVLWLYKEKPLEMFSCPTMDEVSTVDEDERAFRTRVAQTAREQRDSALDKIREDYANEIDSLTRAKARAEKTAATQEAQASSHTMGTVISIGTSVLSSLFSSRRGYSGIARSAQRIGTTMKERNEAAAAEQEIVKIDEDLARIEKDIQDKLARFQNQDLVEIERLSLLPYKKDIIVKKCALGWIPND